MTTSDGCLGPAGRAPAARHRPQRTARRRRRAHRGLPGSELVRRQARPLGSDRGWSSSSRTSRSPSTGGCGWSASPSSSGVRRHRRLPAGRGHRPVPGRRRRAHPRLPRVRPGGCASATSSSTPGRSSRRHGWSAARRDGPFDALQACNPPDIFWPIARWLRRRDGTRFVFDHHDLCPELYLSRFEGSQGAPVQGLLFLERETFQAADRVTSTNESTAAIAASRGKPVEHVSVVRTGPDPDRLRRREPVPPPRRGQRHLVAYLGVMGPQDGVDLALGAADVVVNAWGATTSRSPSWGRATATTTWSAATARAHRGRRPPGPRPGRLRGRGPLHRGPGAVPDPLNPLNDVSTMNKTMEYMSFGLPVVAFDLRETRVSAADAAHYVRQRRPRVRPRHRLPRGRPGARPADDGPARARAHRAAPRLGAPAGGLPARVRRPGGPRARPAPLADAGPDGVRRRRGVPAARRQGARHGDGRPDRAPGAGCRCRRRARRPRHRGRPRPPPPVDHRPVERRRPAVRQGGLTHLQR